MVFLVFCFSIKGVTVPKLCFGKIGQSVVYEVDCGGEGQTSGRMLEIHLQ